LILQNLNQESSNDTLEKHGRRENVDNSVVNVETIKADDKENGIVRVFQSNNFIIKFRNDEFMDEFQRVPEMDIKLDSSESKSIGNLFGLALIFMFLLIFFWLNRRMVIKILTSCCLALDCKTKRSNILYRYERQFHKN